MLIYANETKLLNLSKVLIDIPVRYGNEEIPNDFPCRFKQDNDYDRIKLVVDSNTGRILNKDFPVDFKFEIDTKVCDEGIYILLDANDNELFKIKDYVPDFLPNEYGDYINLKIENGFITNWIKENKTIYIEN